MFGRAIIRALVFTYIGIACGATTTYGSAQEAWGALHNLEISEAKTLFRQELEQSPADVSLMRGLLLAAYFDLDHRTQVEMIDAMIEAEPGHPYLVPVFEHVAAEMSDWGDQIDIMYRLGKSLHDHGTASLGFVGRNMMLSYHIRADTIMPVGWFEKLGYVAGCWTAGPFENHSNIAAYRKVPFEGRPLDTMAVTAGKNGTAVGWTWLDNDRYGDIFPFLAIEDDLDVACQVRTFFELPRDDEVFVLLGGAYNCRVLLDGIEIHDDPKYRNAVLRGGFRTRLPVGAHEVTLIIGAGDMVPMLTVSILDSRYEPIEGISWPRFASVKYGDSVEATRFHPIFDSFEDFVSAEGKDPDTRYWRTILHMYNGYQSEIVRELEVLHEQDSLTLLETWALYNALLANEEPAMAVDYLGEVKKAASTALVDWTWINSTVENYEAQIAAFIELDERYPDRYELEMMASIKPILSGDVQQLIANMDTVAAEYPGAVSVLQFMTYVYTNLTQDSKAAGEWFVQSCERSKNLRDLLIESSGYAIFKGLYEEAILDAHTAYRLYPGDGTLGQLFAAYNRVQRTAKMVPLLDSLRRRYPYNLDIHTLLHEIHTNEGNFEGARDILREIHEVKPAAVMPYRKLDSLHNNVSYDSIFGGMDVPSLWDVEPSEEELANNNYWYLLDRRQKLVFESGMALNDIHWAIALLDKDAVESMQEYHLGFDSDDSYNTLLTARRLRKDQPPLPGRVEGASVVFQDLEPGDAIEIQYRFWSANSGDLWNEFWDTYIVYSAYYQRKWEYTILTNRDDVLYMPRPPAPEPDISRHCDFTKITWSGEHSAGRQLDLALLPPYDDIIGKIFVTTIADWETVNEWYLSISEAVLGDNPRTKTLAEKLTADLHSDRDKLRALYKYVVLEIPYQTIGFDYHVSIPHKPDEVLINKWGDCKDKGHLLVQLLRQVGIEARPVLVMTRDNGTDLPAPAIKFNHLITQCILDGDTLYIDPTSVAFPLEYSLDERITGQPCLPIFAGNTSGLRRLPEMTPRDYHWISRLEVAPTDNGEFAFAYESKNSNLRAGYSRNRRRGLTASQVREDLESALIDNWGVGLKLDSMTHDSVNSIDTVYTERSFGTVDLKVQSIGKTTILELPDWSLLTKVLLSELVYDGERSFPVDLHNFVGHYTRIFEFVVPPHFGVPQPTEPFAVEDSLWTFDYGYEWNPDSRLLSITFMLEISEGLTDVEPFIAFAQQVIDAFESPVLFMRE